MRPTDAQIELGAKALTALQGQECIIREHGNALQDPLPAALCDDCEAREVATVILTDIEEKIEALRADAMVNGAGNNALYAYDEALAALRGELT